MKRSLLASLVLVFLCVVSSNSWAQRSNYECEATTVAAYNGALVYGQTRSKKAAQKEAMDTYKHASRGGSIELKKVNQLLEPVIQNPGVDPDISAYFIGMSTYGKCKSPLVHVSQTPQRSQYAEIQCLLTARLVARAAVTKILDGRKVALDRYRDKLPDLDYNLPHFTADIQSFTRNLPLMAGTYTLYIIDRATGCIRKRLVNG